jgi:acetyl esterase/lipase
LHGLRRYSPTKIVQDLHKKYKLVDASGGIRLPFPPTVLVHGTADVTMPSKASEEFGKALEEIGVKVEVKLHLGKTHTGTSSHRGRPTINCLTRWLIFSRPLSLSLALQTASWRTSSWART